MGFNFLTHLRFKSKDISKGLHWNCVLKRSPFRAEVFFHLLLVMRLVFISFASTTNMFLYSLNQVSTPPGSRSVDDIAKYFWLCDLISRAHRKNHKFNPYRMHMRMAFDFSWTGRKGRNKRQPETRLWTPSPAELYDVINTDDQSANSEYTEHEFSTLMTYYYNGETRKQSGCFGLEMWRH